MTSEIRVRFPPSPTGLLHLGSARTAFFNYLFARHHKGKFILRIEDTDRKRYEEGALEEIFNSLQWLGLNWDEGPKIGGSSSSYFQSERLDLYKKYASQLLENGYAYRCFCTPERLAVLREKKDKTKSTSISSYDRKCRNLSEKEKERLLAEKTPYTIRFKIPLEKIIAFTDLIHGKIEHRGDLLEDIVLLKSDGFPTYHLANVVDDHDMQISHILRGDEWLVSTPLYILIYEAFGWSPPQYAHLPLILAQGGGKLSKRKHAASVTDYRKQGYLPEALLNYLALLGWAPGDDREIMSVDEIIEAFSLERISPKPSVFDQKKLEWMNGIYMQKSDIDSIAGDIIQIWKKADFIDKDKNTDDPYCLKVINLLKNRSKRINELAENANYFFVDPKEYDAGAVKKHFKGDIINILKRLVEKLELLNVFTADSLETIFRDYAEADNLSGAKLIHPTRVAVSGVSFGPGLFELLETLGKNRVIRRMKAAIEWLEARDKNEIKKE